MTAKLQQNLYVYYMMEMAQGSQVIEHLVLTHVSENETGWVMFDQYDLDEMLTGIDFPKFKEEMAEIVNSHDANARIRFCF